MQHLLQEALIQIGDHSEVKEIRAVAGGDINAAYYVRTVAGQYFVKYNPNIRPGFFRQEAHGLERIRATGAISVPKVYLALETAGRPEGLLILEWIEGRPTRTTEEQLGHQLAALHQCTADRFGLDADNFIGTLPQPNGWYDNWIDYYRERRLFPQMTIAEQQGRLPAQRKKRLLQLAESLEKWLPARCQPSLLHGDLWSGNWLPGPGGTPYLIDPSVFYGHFELELAFTELFGGFSERFYQNYAEIQPLSPEYPDRKPLYQLFYLLVHLNLFGESYGRSVDRILERYLGWYE